MYSSVLDMMQLVYLLATGSSSTYSTLFVPSSSSFCCSSLPRGSVQKAYGKHQRARYNTQQSRQLGQPHRLPVTRSMYLIQHCLAKSKIRGPKICSLIHYQRLKDSWTLFNYRRCHFLHQHIKHSTHIHLT
jgi:hypothetical protein